MIEITPELLQIIQNPTLQQIEESTLKKEVERVELIKMEKLRDRIDQLQSEHKRIVKWENKNSFVTLLWNRLNFLWNN